MFSSGNIACAEGLIKPARKVLKLRDTLSTESSEHRIALWNDVREAYDSYLDGACGAFVDEVDAHFQSQFEAALLVLSTAFEDAGDSFAQAARFTPREREALRALDTFSSLEVLSVEDLKKTIIARDDAALRMLRDYYLFGDTQLDAFINDVTIQRAIRRYLNTRWAAYKQQLNEAVAALITDLDWLRVLVRQWEHETAVQDAAAERGAVQTRMTQEEKIAQALRTVEAGDGNARLILRSAARQAELNFVGRLEQRVSGRLTLGGARFKVLECDETLDADAVRAFGRTGTAIDAGVWRQVPENRGIVATLVKKTVLRRPKRILFRAMALSRIDRYAEQGFDVQPLSLEEITPVLSGAVAAARIDAHEVVLCIASPTGFDDTVYRHVTGLKNHKNFSSPHVSLMLLDLETAKLSYNQHDARAAAFAPLCELEQDAEKKARIRACVEQRMTGDWITLEDACTCGDEPLVRAVFYELAEAHGWAVRHVDTVGLVLVR